MFLVVTTNLGYLAPFSPVSPLYQSSGQVDAAIKLSETELKGRRFFVEYAQPRDR